MKPNYSDLHANTRHKKMELQNMTILEDIGAKILEYIPTQYSLEKGLKVFGEKSTKKELTQLHDLDTFEPIDAEKNLQMVENNAKQLPKQVQLHPL